MEKYLEIKSIEHGLEECKKIVLDDMSNSSRCLIEEWDGEKCNVTPEEHFNDIVEWCRNNIKSSIWSFHRKSTRYTWITSYGAKHRCESQLRCYVANNWMKLAMIYAGLEVTNDKNIDYDGKLLKTGIRLDEILTNSINFICRKSNKSPKNFISSITKELNYK